MSDTFSQIYIQLVFAVRGRSNLLSKLWRDELFRYIAGIIKTKNQNPIIVNGVGDHVHIFVGINPATRISDLVRDIKCNSTNFINKKKFVEGRFSWQDGYGAFSYSHSQIHDVREYIKNQEEHHRKKTFQEEYLQFLKKFEIPYNEKYLFEWISDGGEGYYGRGMNDSEEENGG